MAESEEHREDKNYAWGGQKKKPYLCLEDYPYLDNDMWGHLKGYITDAEQSGNGGEAAEWATKV